MNPWKRERCQVLRNHLGVSGDEQGHFAATPGVCADAIAELEKGAGAVLTSSGMSAITLALALLEPGALVVAPHDCYGGTYRLLRVADVAWLAKAAKERGALAFCANTFLSPART